MATLSYSLLDFGHEQRLEQWGEYILIRPDPTALGEPKYPELWEEAHAMYVGEKGKGEWQILSDMPEQWNISVENIELTVRLAPFKHTGVFPEQAQNWHWMRQAAKNAGKPLNILNLFAYTGGATIALAKDGHKVTHVDSSKPAISWAKENAALNGLPAHAIRWIVEDAAVFVSRERKRGNSYHAILLDPPVYGHAPKGKAWRVERDLKPLLEDCAALLSASPCFLLLNGYAHHDTPESFHRLLMGILKTAHPEQAVRIHTSELSLTTKDGRSLSTGTVARCAFA